MLKKILANTMLRKICVFCVVFVIAAVSMGTILPGSPDKAAENFAQVPVMRATAYDNAGMTESAAAPESPPSDTPPYDIQEFPSGEDGDSQVSENDGGDIAQEEVKKEEAVAVLANVHYTAPLGWTGAPESFIYVPDIPLSEELQAYTYSLCEEQGVSYTLVLALMWRESRFQTQAVGYNKNGTSDSGIMQINDVNREWLHRELNISNLLDPYQNIEAGIEILSRFHEKYGEHGALMAYQYGEAGMKAKIEQGVTTNRQIEILYEKRAEFDMLLSAAQNPSDAGNLNPADK